MLEQLRDLVATPVVDDDLLANTHAGGVRLESWAWESNERIQLMDYQKG